MLQILRCPVTQKGLTLARRDLLGKVNAAIEAGTLRNRDGNVLAGSMDAALVTDDGKVLYPIMDGIPVLLEDESVNLEQLGG
ncbi:hypothetical protein [uncultured Nitratireductor sp.]|uniref:Trm112 family protein n=1 Tax=uncultured Nitratireductor sp. TaxID=520953 RepID=UPI0025FB2BEB|nr:hypothetical protein [uncultured Nitratireductor sp.]